MEERLEDLERMIKAMKISQRSQHDVIQEILLKMQEFLIELLREIPKTPTVIDDGR